MTNGRCRMHGGKTPGGVASPSFKTGRYSKYLPSRLTERYQAALDDRELLVLRDEIALVDARISDLLQRAETGDSAEFWEDLQKTIDACDKVPIDPMPAVRELVQHASEHYSTWSSVQIALEQRRRLVESERKRLVEAQQIITVEQAMALLAAVVEVIRGHVTDRETLAAISQAVRQLMAANTNG